LNQTDEDNPIDEIFPQGCHGRWKYKRKNNTPANIGSLQEKMVTS